MAALALLVSPAALADHRPTQAEALALAFPGAELSRQEYFLTPAQLQAAATSANVPVKSKYVVIYEARKGGVLQGVGIFDTHVVRTQPETVMVAISPAGVVLRIEVVQFREPQEYSAPARWTAQLTGKTLTPTLSLKGEIKPISGASLTAQAMVDASRRALALFQVLRGAPDGGTR